MLIEVVDTIDIAQKMFIRFVFIGIVNTMFGYAVFSLFLFLGFHYTVASLLATVVGVLFNFLTTGRFVFNNRDHSLLGKFFLVYAIVYGCNVGALTILETLAVNLYLAGALLLLPLALLSYVLNKQFVFDVKK